MGLQLLLPVPQAEGIGAPLGCITSARELGTCSGLSQANTVPSAQDPGGANALLETRATLEWVADGKVKAQKRKCCSPQGQRETGRGCAPWQERALPSVGSLQPLRACGGCQADLKEGQVAAENVLECGHPVIQEHRDNPWTVP